MSRRLVLAMMGMALAGCGSDGPTDSSGVASVRMNANAIQLLPGATEQLAATALDASGGTVAGAPAAAWASSSLNVATVTQAGLVTAVGVGQADVTATIGGKKGTTRVTVGQAPLTVTVSMPGNSFAPFTSTIRRTGTVNFEFPATPHNVIFANTTGSPANIQIESNKTIARQFNTVGLFRYDCTIHPGMAGEVNVVQ